MIAFHSDYLLFQLAGGESIPLSAETITIELICDSMEKFDPELLQHAAAAVFYYFKHELRRENVTIGEFAEAMEKVLRGLGFKIRSEECQTRPRKIAEADLLVLASESADNLELFFFSRLRNELRSQLQRAPHVLRFRGLRGCVKQITGAQRWSGRCEKMQDQIVEYLRGCLTAEPEPNKCALVVE